MAVRLHMNLGFVAEPQRLPDSADTVVVVEPNIGSTSRTKGSLYLLVTGTGGRKLRDATRLVADRIRDDYYYDLSAGISVCLRKAVQTANRILYHSPDRPVVGQGETPPIGIAVAVVRGNELYVATVGPVEAYLVRQARLLTLPDSSPDTGLPSVEIESLDVWHGEIAAGDCLILISPNVTRRIGLGPIQDAVLQLHPQAAVEEIQRQFGSGGLGSTGGDGCLFVEATEVAATHKATPLKPVWPSDSLAGAPDRSPIPLADVVGGGVAVAQGTARHVQIAADGWLRRSVYNMFDRLPQRPMSRGRVTPLVVRRERRQRAAIAIIGMISVIALVGTSMWFLSGTRGTGGNIPAQQQAQDAFAKARANIDAVFGNGRDLVTTDPKAADTYLELAFTQLQTAEQNGYPADLLTPSRQQVIDGLDRYFGVTTLHPIIVASFTTDDLGDLVLGPDGAAYLIDSTSKYVYRVNLETKATLTVTYENSVSTVGQYLVGAPTHLAVGGPDVLMLDSLNSLWTWQPALGDKTGRGVLKKVSIPDNANWGLGIRGVGAFVTNDKLGLYNLYIIVPTAQQILKYQPAQDGTGYPKDSKSPYLSLPQDVSSVDDMYVDGKIFLVDHGQLNRYDRGQVSKGWSTDLPKDKVIRPLAPIYKRVTADNPAQDKGNFYAFDSQNRRILALQKSDGAVVGEYIAPVGTPWLTSVKGMFVIPGTSTTSPILYWTEGSSLLMAYLDPDLAPAATPSPSAVATKSVASPGPSAKK